MRCLVTAHDTQEGGPVPPQRPSLRQKNRSPQLFCKRLHSLTGRLTGRRNSLFSCRAVAVAQFPGHRPAVAGPCRPTPVRDYCPSSYVYNPLPFPRSLPEFQRLFPDGTACAAYIAGDVTAPTYAELYSGDWEHPRCSGGVGDDRIGTGYSHCARESPGEEDGIERRWHTLKPFIAS